MQCVYLGTVLVLVTLWSTGVRCSEGGYGGNGYGQQEQPKSGIRVNLGLKVPPITIKFPRVQLPQLTLRAHITPPEGGFRLQLPQITLGEPAQEKPSYNNNNNYGGSSNGYGNGDSGNSGYGDTGNSYASTNQYAEGMEHDGGGSYKSGGNYGDGNNEGNNGGGNYAASAPIGNSNYGGENGGGQQSYNGGNFAGNGNGGYGRSINTGGGSYQQTRGGGNQNAGYGGQSEDLGRYESRKVNTHSNYRQAGFIPLSTHGTTSRNNFGNTYSQPLPSSQNQPAYTDRRYAQLTRYGYDQSYANSHMYPTLVPVRGYSARSTYRPALTMAMMKSAYYNNRRAA